jgi:hypothetical protein
LDGDICSRAARKRGVMGTIRATCQHEITGEWMDDPRSSIVVADWVIDYAAECFVPAIAHLVVCPACREKYEREGLILDAARQEAHLHRCVKPNLNNSRAAQGA